MGSCLAKKASACTEGGAGSTGACGPREGEKCWCPSGGLSRRRDLKYDLGAGASWSPAAAGKKR